MFIGIDVGGTFTDAAAVSHDKVLAWAKVETTEDILQSVTTALDKIIASIEIRAVERVVLSTTLITNLIAESKMNKVGLLIMPGPGARPEEFEIFKDAYVIPGAIDYRGRETEPLDMEAAIRVLADIANRKLNLLAVVGKFSIRNSAHEVALKEIAKKLYPEIEVELGHVIGGKLNFPRRAATTIVTAATRKIFKTFAYQAELAIRGRGIEAPIFFLKADGGTMSLAEAIARPAETVFSGPAASAMGALALGAQKQTAVVVDIGGTTTDLALLLSGKPLLSSKGSKIGSYLTQVRGFSVRSLALGGDSKVVVQNNQLRVLDKREGSAMCIGGPAPTPTDALRYLGLTEMGSYALAQSAIQQLQNEYSRDVTPSELDIAQHILEVMVDQIATEVQSMFLEWEQEPAYRVWEIMQRNTQKPDTIFGVGGASPALIPKIAEKLSCNYLAAEYAPVANAIGTALARPTTTVTLRVDTEQGIFNVAEDGEQGCLSGREKERFHFQEAEELALRLLQERIKDSGQENYAAETETTHRELFNIVRGWTRVGRIIDITVQAQPGIIEDWQGHQ